MATTEIHAITTTPNKALNYILADKIVEIKSDDEINKEIPYSIEEKNGRNYVHYYTITGFQNCSIQNPFDAYKDRQEKWQGVRYKNGGSKTKSGNEPVMYHLHQSFEGFEVSYETANEIGRKLAEEIFSGYVVTVSTHGNTDNIHNHFMISAWDENGKKWNDCHETKRLIRNVSDRLCKEYGLSVLEHTRDMKLIKYKDTDGKTHYLSDGKLMETQTANYFSDIYPIDCAVLSANAYSCQKGCTLLSILFSAGNAKGHGSHHETHGPYEKFSFSPACRPEREDEPGRWRQSPHPPSASGSRSFLHSKRYRRNRRARTLHHG